MSASELEHAQATLTGLLQLLVKHTRAPLVVSQLEGDAVMSYALEESGVSGQTFLEVIEDWRFAGRENRAIRITPSNVARFSPYLCAPFVTVPALMMVAPPTKWSTPIHP